MSHRDLIVIGASAGGIEALQTLVAGLPAAFPAALLVVVHVSAQSPRVLARILDRAGALPADYAADGAVITQGQIYVAPPNTHLVVEPGRLRLTQGPKENRFRPAIDPLFRSAAAHYGPRVVGIILSGMLDDGTAGLWSIKDRGGLAVVQEPNEAPYASMPESALKHVVVDYRVPVTTMGSLLTRLVTELRPREGDTPMTEMLAIENKIAWGDPALPSGVLGLGTPSLYTCPECHGVLLQVQAGPVVRFRCHTGHAYTLASLLAEVNESVEATLWSTVRVLEEKVLLLHHLIASEGPSVADEAFHRTQQQVAETEQILEHLHQLVRQSGSGGETKSDNF